MRGARLILPGFCLLAVLALAGCSGLDYMIEEYNSRFGIHDDRPMYPGDIGYDEKDMIRLEDYHVETDHTLDIPAPRVQGASYQWDLYESGTGRLVKTDYDGSHHTFQLYIQGNLGLGTYKLVLTLTVGDKVYRDEAWVTVKEPEQVG